MTRILAAYLLMVCSSVVFCSDKIYQCVDNEGSVEFTNISAKIEKSGSNCKVKINTAQDLGRSSQRKQNDDSVQEVTNTRSRSVSPPLRMSKTSQAPIAIPSFINMAQNYFEAANSDAFATFKNRWHMKNESIRILHLGDSHVRNGFTGEVARRELQAVRGNGGRGMVFPYALAKTYPQSDYQSTMEGVWQSSNSVRPLSNMDLGVTGVTARTLSTPAAFTLSFAQAQPVGGVVVKVFLKSSMLGLRLTASTAKESVNWSTQETGQLPTIATFTLYKPFNRLRIDINSSGNEGGQFELYGVNIEAVSSGGVVYHSFGVDGATLGSLNTEMQIDAQLAELKPDLIVLDFGSNELIGGKNALSSGYEAMLVRLVRRLRAARPQMAIVFATPQDMRYKGRDIATDAYSKFVRKLAFEHGCLFWNWYRVAGEDGAIQAWLSHSLANRDQVHLLAKGYKLKGDLLAKALLSTLKN